MDEFHLEFRLHYCYCYHYYYYRRLLHFGLRLVRSPLRHTLPTHSHPLSHHHHFLSYAHPIHWLPWSYLLLLHHYHVLLPLRLFHLAHFVHRIWMIWHSVHALPPCAVQFHVEVVQHGCRSMHTHLNAVPVYAATSTPSEYSTRVPSHHW